MPPWIAAFWIFHFDHFSTKLGQNRGGKRCSDKRCDIEYSNTCEGEIFFAIRHHALSGKLPWKCDIGGHVRAYSAIASLKGRPETNR